MGNAQKRRRDEVSTMRCSGCGYRQSSTALACINCGQALAQPSPLPVEEPVAAPLPEVVAGPPAEPHLSELRLSPERVVQPPAKEINARLARQLVAEREIVRPARTDESWPPAVRVNQVGNELSPYQTTLRELAPFQNMVPSDARRNIRDDVRGPLPFGLAWTRPRLYGTIIALEVREQASDLPNIGGAILMIVAEVFWALLNVHTTREAVERIEVTRLRIEASDGSAHDAILLGVQRGANLSLGDTVSLWGHRRRGNLVIHKGYDHTTRSRISSSARGLLLPALLLLLILGVLFLSLSHTSLLEVWKAIKGLPAWFKK